MPDFSAHEIAELSSWSEQTPSPCAVSDELSNAAGAAHADPRLMDAWCTWLRALATDAEAALAAAIAYRELDAWSRNRWLLALEQDAEQIRVPRIAVYAPLLAVESDPDRRARITQAMGSTESAIPRRVAQGMVGRERDGTRVAVLISPLYLDFVQILACGFRPEHGFTWVRHDPIVAMSHAPRPGDRIEGVVIERAPLKALIDDLALAVLSHQRSGRELPEALRIFADLFGPAYECIPPTVLL